MKAILKFNLPDEELEFRRATQSLNLALALWDIDKYLRNIMKNGAYNIDSIQEEFYRILHNYDINFDNLIE